MLFIDDATAERVGLVRIRQRLRPLSPYGTVMKQRMPVYLPGTETQLQREWTLLKAILDKWTSQPGVVQNLELTLHTLRDIRTVVTKAYQGFVLDDIELFSIKRFLELTGKLNEAAKILELPQRLIAPESPMLYSILSAGGKAGFYLDDSFAPGLAALREERRRLNAELSRRKTERQELITRETGKTFNHQGRLQVSKLEGRLLQQLKELHYLVMAAETYTEVEFVLREDEATAVLRYEIDQAESKIDALEFIAREKLSRKVAATRRGLLAACRRLGRLDLLLAKARLARETGWCVPELTQNARIELVDFVNPVVSEYLTEQGTFFQALSLSLGSTAVTVITGANMGGKSVSLKSVGLAAAMAQIGLLVPAKAMKLSLRSFIFYSQHDENPGQGLSTFGAEIHALAAVLPHRYQRGLYLLDEPARGTNPWEGSALVRAVAEWLGMGNSLSLIATHFPGLSDLDGVTHWQVAGLAEADPDSLRDLGDQGLNGLSKLMNYALVPGRGDVPRDALKIAAFLGLEPEILARASQELGLMTLKELRE